MSTIDAVPAGGRRVRIAVIDSGVHPGHSHILADRLLPGVEFTATGAIVEGAEATRDRIGHGTAVAAAIQELAPAADIIPVRVFGEALKTSANVLAAAILWSVENGADIVNLSLGTTNAAHRPRFEEAIAVAVAANVLVVAPRIANDLECLPGSLEGVLGVDLDWECPRDRCRVEEGRLFASGYPRPIEGVPPTRNLYGVSFAAARISGMAAVALAEARIYRPDERPIRESLIGMLGSSMA